MTVSRQLTATAFLTAGLLAAGGFLSAAEAKNLLKDGDFENPQINLNKWGSSWRGSCWVWKNGLTDEAHRKRITDGQIRSLEAGSGVNNSRCGVIYSPDELKKEQNKAGNPCMSSSILQAVALPDSAQSQKYTLTFKVKGKTAKSPGLNSLRLFVYFYDRIPGKPGTKAVRKEIMQTVNLTEKYELRTVSFEAPAHTRRLDIWFSLYGQGKVYLDDASLVKAAASAK